MSKVASAAVAMHRNSLEAVRPEMAKADLNKVEDRDFKAEIGRAIQRAFSIAGLSQKEAAGMLQRDPGQVARWIAGTETPQFAVLFSLEELRWPLVQALASLAQAEVITEIRRRA